MQLGGTLLQHRSPVFDAPPNLRSAGELVESRDLPNLRLRERVYPAGLRLPKHSHAKALLVYVIEGNVVEESEGAICRCQPGTLRYIAAGSAHANEFASETRCLIVEIEPDTLGLMRDCAVILEHSFGIETPQAALLARRLALEFRERDEAASIAIAGVVLEILAEGVRARGCASRHAPRWLVRARSMIEARFLDVPSLTSIAGAVGVHPVHLSREFRRYFDCTVGDYMRKLRIEHASRLLASTTTPLSEIAEVCGFADQSHFSSAFKRTVGLTPARFRGLHG